MSEEKKNTYRLIIESVKDWTIREEKDERELVEYAYEQWLTMDTDVRSEIVRLSKKGTMFQVVDDDKIIWDFVLMTEMERIRANFFTDLYSLDYLKDLRKLYIEDGLVVYVNDAPFFPQYRGTEPAIELYLNSDHCQIDAENLMNAIAINNAISEKEERGD